MRRFWRAVICAFGLAVSATQAAAQTYPLKPIRIIVPYAPGGLTDVVARLYSEQLRQSFGRGVFVENIFFLATTTNFPPQTFADFLAYAKKHPGKVRYGSAGVGSYQQINTEILAKRAGLDLVHIPFKGGGAEILRDLANGDIQVSWFNITNPVGMMKAGRVRALAIAADERLPQHADVPTIAEVGVLGSAPRNGSPPSHRRRWRPRS
jgi:tripartite-type tricarboxylate transporter receptor subunit TctC